MRLLGRHGLLLPALEQYALSSNISQRAVRVSTRSRQNLDSGRAIIGPRHSQCRYIPAYRYGPETVRLAPYNRSFVYGPVRIAQGPVALPLAIHKWPLVYVALLAFDPVVVPLAALKKSGVRGAPSS